MSGAVGWVKEKTNDATDFLLSKSVSQYNDIAILILASPVVYTTTVSPVCLPQQGSTNDQEFIKEASSVGWGTIREGIRTSAYLRNNPRKSPSSDKGRTRKERKEKRIFWLFFLFYRSGVFFSSTALQHTTVKILDNSQCKESYPNIIGSMLCAIAPESNTCQVLRSTLFKRALQFMQMSKHLRQAQKKNI